MSETPANQQPDGTKRKPSATAESAGPKKSKTAPNGPTTPLPTHDALIAELSSKYDILPAFTISSTKIQKRVNWLLRHLRKDDGDPRKRVVLLYARPSEVVKMITIVELVKRIVAEEDEGGWWYQYNQMYALPPKAEVVEETMLGGGDDFDESGAAAGSDNDDFEIMESRFERAVLPQLVNRAAKSLSVFLSLVPIPELKAKDDVTTQTNEPQGVSKGPTAP
ncbi:hypothetical protein CTA2_7745 [Colletotrichum tanaceti]|uniref:DNA/RNA-binding protein Alba-like domain-containing protein n=1 Tax=Colletotrichum tanaceti TaxID=1306861 RepID=A0A4U6XAW5_9PEZI|nr:hypothetical protein CTA2_7745 [Colletotrichum tanaceti]TKW52504.1 hypothetical protein CTA1_5819 [Colletotrichum tanaceti]